MGQQPSESAPDSEVDGFVLAGWAEATQFSTTRLRPGYDKEEVDSFLGAIRDTFLGIRKPSLTPDEIRNKQFSTTRLRPGYDEEEVDAFLDEAELKLAAQVSAWRETPVAGQVSSGAGQAASAATAGLATQKPYVPGRGDEVPPGLRGVLQGYSWMAWGVVFCGWALLMADAYVDNMNSTSDPRFLLASIAPAVLAAVLFGQHIRWSWFLRRPRDARGATVAACQHGGHALMLDASCDGYLPGLQVRLPWWTGPEMLLPGEGVTLYGRPSGAGRLLVSSSAWCRAFAGNGRRRPAPWVGEEIAQDVPHQPGQRAERRYLQWGPQIVFGLGLVVAVTATLMAWDPPLTGHLGAGQLRTGDCLTGTNLGLGGDNPWPYMFTAVPCTGPHLAEVFFAGTAWPKSLTAYPGDNAIFDRGNARCLTAFGAYDGTDNSISSFTIDDIEPYGSDDWASGDRWLVCLAYESTDQYPGGAPVNYSIKGSQQ